MKFCLQMIQEPPPVLEQNIEEKIEFLINFLDLPPASRKVSQLSGGQQRRVSFAVALLHSPEVLILDEPTVGVDPLLRQKIWKYLGGISANEGTTIIITTHYIEEARSAHTVGLMRNGQILAEDSPEALLQKFKQSSLEGVFLNLCVMAEDRREGDLLDVTPADVDEDDVRLLGSQNSHSMSYRVAEKETQPLAHCMRECCSSIIKPRNVGALLIKNVHQLRRRIGFLLFQFLLPAIQIALFAFCVGGTPKDLPVEIVNFDEGFKPCGKANVSFSEAFISQLDLDIIHKERMSSVDVAKQNIVDGKSVAVIVFDKNFTIATVQRALDPSKNSTALNESIINVWMDESNPQLVLPIQAQLLNAFQNMGPALEKKVKEQCNITHLPISVQSVELPISYRKPIYGKDNETFLDFMAPGIMCSIIFFLAVGLTSLSLVLERKEGLFERCLVSGVSVVEMMLGHMGMQFLVMAIQTAVLLIFSLLVFNVYNVGPIIVIIMFELLIGFCGMCLGFVISTGATDESSALQMSLAIVFPFLLISGILWPLQSMPKWLQYIAIWLPLCLPVRGLRGVLGRGWGFDHYDVWSGYCVGMAWAVGFLILSLIISRVRKLN